MLTVRNIIYKKEPLNKLHLKRQMYRLCIKEGTSVLEHLRIISKLLAVDVKVDEEDKMLILPSSLLNSYDYTVTNMLAHHEGGHNDFAIEGDTETAESG